MPKEGPSKLDGSQKKKTPSQQSSRKKVGYFLGGKVVALGAGWIPYRFPMIKPDPLFFPFPFPDPKKR